ncbi:MAG TPA: cobalt ECF transporter T component CbiQ [Methanocella sp.]|nr:cobalt ECF transporter T component CbiQ [Methanocella sp.]
MMTFVNGIDSLAYKSPALRWPPLGKMLLCVCMLVGSLSSKALYGPLTVLGVGLFLFLYSIRFRAPSFILCLIAGVLAFNLAGTVVILVTQPGAPLYSVQALGMQVSVTRNGVDLSTLVFARSLAGMFVVLFFASSTPVPHIFNALMMIGVPEYMAETSMLLYRHSFMILERAEQMVNAADCRLGFSGWQTSIKTTGVLAANLFIRSLDCAERSQIALMSRNFSGSFPVLREPRPMNISWVMLSLAALGSLLLLGNFLR